MPLDTIKAGSVEAYIAGKLAGAVYKDGREVRRESPLSARSINMTLILLGAILERAVKHELIDRNAAKGCRARERAPARSYLETAGQIRALLDAAGELDAGGTEGTQTHGAPRDARHARRSPACGSASCWRCVGVTWTSPPDGCTRAPRPTRAETGS